MNINHNNRASTLVETYFERAVEADLDSYFELFSDDVVIEDEGREHHGIAAVRGWRTEVPPVTYAVQDIAVEGDTAVAVARIGGDFPGSPVDLQFRFRFDQDEKISELRIRS